MRHEQSFRYVLTLNEAEYRERWTRHHAEAIARVAGLVQKTGMADFDTGTLARVYFWEDKASADAFMASPAIAQVAQESVLKGLVTTAIPVHEGTSEITRG